MLSKCSNVGAVIVVLDVVIVLAGSGAPSRYSVFIREQLISVVSALMSRTLHDTANLWSKASASLHSVCVGQTSTGNPMRRTLPATTYFNGSGSLYSCLTSLDSDILFCATALEPPCSLLLDEPITVPTMSRTRPEPRISSDVVSASSLASSSSTLISFMAVRFT